MKQLAAQTSQATNEIVAQVSAIQAETEHAVQAIRTISQTIENVDRFASSIAAAVEQQSATTNQIGSNIDSAASGTGAVAADIQQLNSAVLGTDASAIAGAECLAIVRTVTNRLEQEIDGFLRSSPPPDPPQPPKQKAPAHATGAFSFCPYGAGRCPV